MYVANKDLSKTLVQPNGVRFLVCSGVKVIPMLKGTVNSVYQKILKENIKPFV